MIAVKQAFISLSWRIIIGNAFIIKGFQKLLRKENVAGKNLFAFGRPPVNRFHPWVLGQYHENRRFSRELECVQEKLWLVFRSIFNVDIFPMNGTFLHKLLHTVYNQQLVQR